MAPKDGIITCGTQSSTPLHGGEERVQNASKGGDWAKANKGKAEAAFTFIDHCSSAEPIQVCGAMVVAAIATRLRATPRTPAHRK
jgi:hypothetical protein